MKLKPINHKRLVKLLNLVGYSPARQKGSHLILENKDKNKIIVVPIRTKDIGIGLLSTILKEVGLSREEYFKSYDSTHLNGWPHICQRPFCMSNGHAAGFNRRSLTLLGKI